MAIAMHATDSMRSLAVEVISDRGRFARMRAEWEDLLARARCQVPCLGLDWLDAWWEAFAEGELRLFLVRGDRGRLLAGAPLVWRRARCSGVRLQTVAFAVNLHTPRFDVVLAADHEPKPLLRLLLHHVLAAEPAPDLLLLEKVPYGSGRLDLLRDVALECGLWPGAEEKRCGPVISLHGAWEGYLQGRSKSFRTFLRRCQRQWQEAGADLEVVTDGPRGRELLEEGLALEASGWKGQEGTAILQDRGEAAFYRGLAARLDGTARLRQYALRLRGELVAWDLCLMHDRVCYALKTTYDESRASMSPGFALQMMELQDLLAKGPELATLYDMFPPESEFKRRWADGAIGQFSIRLYTGRPRARLARAVQTRLKPFVRRTRLHRVAKAVFGRRLSALRERLGLDDA
jgi:CelD/BcsL family acetyltransferase involved in cellulose biosynthesis